VFSETIPMYAGMCMSIRPALQTQDSRRHREEGPVSLLLWKVRKKEPRSLANYVPTTEKDYASSFYLRDKG
jgi:hypothetical protein